MGEGTTDMNELESPRELEREVEHIRNDMTDVVRELDRRRHDLFDWRLQLRENALALGVGVISVVCVMGGIIALTAWRARRRRRPLVRLRMYQEALGRMVAHPERVARPQPGVGKKTLAAAATGAAATLIKVAAQQMLHADDRSD
jgi:hypothetical protein